MGIFEKLIAEPLTAMPDTHYSNFKPWAEYLELLTVIVCGEHTVKCEKMKNERSVRLMVLTDLYLLICNLAEPPSIFLDSLYKKDFSFLYSPISDAGDVVCF